MAPPSNISCMCWHTSSTRGGTLGVWDSIGGHNSAHDLPSGQVDGLGGEVPQHNGDTPAPIFKLGVCPHDIQPIREICLIIRVGRLCHNIQPVLHHHRVLGMTMGDNGLETWYRTLVSEQDLLVQVQGVLCSVGREFESFSQACLSKLETLHPLEGDPGCLPL